MKRRPDFDYLVVKHKGLCGAADRNGNIVIPCEYERIFNCDDNIFLVSKNNLFGYINRNNQIIIPFEYERASLFNYGFAIVTKKGSAFVINSQGNLIAKDCDEYYIYSNNLILCSKNNKIGAFDSEGKQIIAFEYSLNTNENNKYIKHNLMTKENGCFILYKGGKYFLFNNKGTGINNIKTNDIKDYYSEYTVVSSGKYAVDIFGRLEFNTLNEAKKYVDSLKVKMVTELPNKYSLIKPEISCHILDRNWKEVLTPAFENIKDFKYYDYYTSLARVRGCLNKTQYAETFNIYDRNKVIRKGSL